MKFTDGTLLWQSPMSPPSNFDLDIPLTPVVVHGIVYAGFGSGIIFSLNASNGTPYGYTALPNHCGLDDACFTVVNGMIYTALPSTDGTHQGIVYKFRPNDGYNPFVWLYKVGSSVDTPITIAP